MRAKPATAAGLALTLAACATSQPNPFVIDTVWFECRRDRQCAIVEDPRCSLMPVNKQYADAYIGWVRLNHPDRVDDRPCKPNAMSYGVVCEAGRCSSTLIGPRTGIARSER